MSQTIGHPSTGPKTEVIPTSAERPVELPPELGVAVRYEHAVPDDFERAAQLGDELYRLHRRYLVDLTMTPDQYEQAANGIVDKHETKIFNDIRRDVDDISDGEIDAYVDNLTDPIYRLFVTHGKDRRFKVESHWQGQQTKNAQEPRGDLRKDYAIAKKARVVIDAQSQTNSSIDAPGLDKAREKLAKKLVKRSYGATGLKGFGLKRAARRYEGFVADLDDKDAEYGQLQALIEEAGQRHVEKSWFLREGEASNNFWGEKRDRGENDNKNRLRSSKKRKMARLVGHAALMYGIRHAFPGVGSVVIGGSALAVGTVSEYAQRMADASGSIMEALQVDRSRLRPDKTLSEALIAQAKENRKENAADLLRSIFLKRNLGRAASMAIGFGIFEALGPAGEVYQTVREWLNGGAEINSVVDSIQEKGDHLVDRVDSYDNSKQNMVNDLKEQLTNVKEEFTTTENYQPTFLEDSNVEVNTEAEVEQPSPAEANTADEVNTEQKSPAEIKPAEVEYEKPVVIKPGDGLTNIVNRMTEGGPGSAAPMIQQAMDMGLGDVKFPDGTMLIEMQDGEPHLTKAGVMPKEAVDILARAADAKGYDLAA